MDGHPGLHLSYVPPGTVYLSPSLETSPSFSALRPGSVSSVFPEGEILSAAFYTGMPPVYI